MNKVRVLVLFFGLLPACLLGQTHTWNGSISGDWGTAANWTPVGIPGAGATVQINTAAVPNNCTLDANRTITNLTVSAGTLNFNGFVLTVSSNTNITNATLQQANLQVVNISTLGNNIFSGAAVIVKTGGGNNAWAGGNTFQSSVSITNQSTGYIRMSDSNADVYQGTSSFTCTNSGALEIARTAAGNTFAGNITLTNSSSAIIRFGGNGGTSTIASGAAIVSGGFSSGTLTLNNITQNGAAANGSFLPTTFNASNTILGGDLSLTVAGVATVNTCTFNRNLTIIAEDLALTNANNFSLLSGATVLTKIGGGDNDAFTGGNTFGGPTTITNQSNNRMRFANTNPDTFLSTLSVVNTGTNWLEMCRTGVGNTIAGNVTLTNTSSGQIRFGQNGGTTTIASGSAILSGGFASGTLVLNNVIQNGTAANGSFSPATFSATNTQLGGNITVNASATFTVSGSSFTATNVFSGNNVNVTNANNFSTVSGSTIITKNGGGDNDWTGGNTFGPVTVINNDDSRIRLATTNGDTYLSTSTFQNNSTNTIDIARAGTNTFAGNITLSNASTGTVAMGQGGGTSTVASGAAILSGGFLSGSLVMNNVTQNGTAANGSFSPATFSATNTQLGGNITVNASGACGINTCTFSATNVFSGTDLNIQNANNFSTTSGTTTMTKNGGGDNDWTGGNTFGTVTIINNDDSRIRLANTTGDTFVSTSNFQNNSTGTIDIARTGSSSFVGNITLANASTGTVGMGRNGGTATIATGAAILSGGFASGSLILNNVTQNGTAANGSFSPSTFSAGNTILRGNIVVNASGSFTINTCTFSATNVFSGTDVDLQNANSLSNVSGSTTITKNGGGDNDWDGNNTFGNITVTNNDDSRIRMADIAGDTYLGTAHFIQNSTGVLAPAFDGFNYFRNSISTTGTTTPITFGSNTGYVVLSDTAHRSITGDAVNPPVFRRLVADMTGDATLLVPVRVSIILTMTNGIIHANATNSLTLIDETVTSNIGNANSYVDGPMLIQMNSNAGTYSILTFPVGKDSAWRPVILYVSHTTTTSYTYRAEVFNNNAHALGWTLPATVSKVSSLHYWDVDRYATATMTTASTTDLRTTAGVIPTITLYYLGIDEVTEPSTLTICKNTAGAPTSWIDIGGVGASAGAGSITSTSAPSAFNSFSRFTIANKTLGISPLPVTFLSVNGYARENKIDIVWKTTQEVNNLYYTLEHSVDGITWTPLVKVSALGGSGELLYTAEHASPISGINYYRIKQTDTDSSFSYSEMVPVVFGDDVSSVSIYPNPTTGLLHVASTDATALSKLKVFTPTGIVCNDVIVTYAEGALEATLDLSSLPQGLYIIQTAAGSYKVSLQ